MKVLIAALALTFVSVTPTFASGSSAGSSTQNQIVLTAADSWFVRLPKNQGVKFEGVVNLDAAGGKAGAMLYPAIDPFSFLAAVMVHGAIENSSRNSEKTKL